MNYFIFSLGCKVNSYESHAVSSALEKVGYFFDENNPDVVIINTCSVTHVADQKSRQHIRKFRNKYPKAILVVMGCFVQSNYEYIKTELDIDILLSTNKRSEIVNYINEYIESKTKIDVADTNTRLFDKYEELGVTAYSENVRAYLKIQDGCDNFCTYCLVPFTRGKSRSRDFDKCIEEAKQLIAKGYQEIVITGIHVGGYGKDNGHTFSELVEALSDIPNLYSLRISSIELSEIDERLINLIKNRKNIAKHLHIPLQSGSNNVLKNMGRKYTREEFIDKCLKVKELLPDVALTSDVIVGFPGESEEDFMDTYHLYEEVGFYQLHVFPYSVRKGTKAERMSNQISPNIKKERVSRLIDLSNKLEERYEKMFIGKELPVLYEQYIDGFNIGHTSNYLSIKVKSNENKVGKIENILIESNNIAKI